MSPGLWQSSSDSLAGVNRNDERVIKGMARQQTLRESHLQQGDRLGWKSGFGTEGAREALGIVQPLAGFLTTATCLDSGEEVDVGSWGMPLIEPEVAVRLATNLGPGASAEDGARAIGAVAASIELVDLGSIESVEDILAGNIFHRHVIIGEFFEVEPDSLPEVRVRVTANDSEGPWNDPREVIGDLGQVVASLADQVDLAGDSFKAGDVVITGAAVPPAPLGPGESYLVETGNGSSVAVKTGSND